jgi:hypothetical protein
MSNDRRVAVALNNRAAAIVGKVRGQQHGDAEESFRMIGEMWATYLRHTMKVKLGLDTPISISPADVANMMADVKRARSVYGDPLAVDNYVDQIGYTSLAGMLALPGIPEITNTPATVQEADPAQPGTPGVDEDKLVEAVEQEVNGGIQIPAFLRTKTEDDQDYLHHPKES